VRAFSCARVNLIVFFLFDVVNALGIVPKVICNLNTKQQGGGGGGGGRGKIEEEKRSEGGREEGGRKEGREGKNGVRRQASSCLRA